MTTEISEFERQQNELELRAIAGKAQHIEINERTIAAYKKAFADKGLVVESEIDLPAEDYHLVKKAKDFDSRVDAPQGIKKVIESMVRQPVTVFNKNGKPEVKDVLYYNGYWYGVDSHGIEIGAEFREGFYKKPKLSFTYVDATNLYDSKTGERRGQYKTVGNSIEHYIFLSSDKNKRRKELETIINEAAGSYTRNLENGHLHYRHPSANNDHSGGHGGSFNWNQFCDLSIEELGECQNKNYYKEKSSALLKDREGVRVEYNRSTDKLEAIK